MTTASHFDSGAGVSLADEALRTIASERVCEAWRKEITLALSFTHKLVGAKTDSDASSAKLPAK
jgi:hypothetical protein